MTQVIQILDKPIKSSGRNSQLEQRGDYPVLAFVADNGAGMSRAVAFAWNENKHSTTTLLTDGTTEVTFPTDKAPLILNKGINAANRSGNDKWGWLQQTIKELGI